MRSDDGGTPLHFAAYNGHMDMVRLLLENGANTEAMRRDDGGTPLDSAAYNGQTDIVRLLLEEGANIEATRSDDGSTPLDSAAYNGHLDAVTFTAKHMAASICFGIGTYQTIRLSVPPAVSMVILPSAVLSGTGSLLYTSYPHRYIFLNLFGQIGIDLLHPQILTV